MAYLKDLHEPICRHCGVKAKVELFNRFNSAVGYYCRRCGKRQENALNRFEKETDHVV